MFNALIHLLSARAVHNPRVSSEAKHHAQEEIEHLSGAGGQNEEDQEYEEEEQPGQQQQQPAQMHQSNDDVRHTENRKRGLKAYVPRLPW